MDKSEFEDINCPHAQTCRLSNMCIVATLIGAGKGKGKDIRHLISSGCRHPENLRVIADYNNINSNSK